MLQGLRCPIGRRCRAEELALAVLLVALGGQPRPLHAQIGQPATTTAIGGRVLNAATGAPLARVLVSASGEAVLTDHDGRFEFTDAGNVSVLLLTKPGFASSPEQTDGPGFPIPKSANPLALEFGLWPEAVLTGTVTGPEGQPLPRVNVVARRSFYEGGVRRWQPSGFAVTNSHGNFRMPVGAGDYVVETRYAPPGSSDADAVLPAEFPRHSLERTATSLHILPGQELHSDLHPAVVPAHKFTLPIDSGSERQIPSLTLRTSDGVLFQPGAMRVEANGVNVELPAGTYQLYARTFGPDGMRTGQAVVSVPDHDSTGTLLQLELVPTIPVEVSVDPADSAGPTSIRASTTVPNPAQFNLQLDPVDGSADVDTGPVRIGSRGNGVASFSAAPGLYRLSGGDGSAWVIESATFGGSDLLRDDLAIGPNGGTEPIRLVVSSRGGTVAGVTRVHGVAAPCWVVLVGTGSALPRSFTRRSDAEGRLIISGVAPGTYRALAMPFLHSADFADGTALETFKSYGQEVTVEPSTTANLSLDAVPAEDLLR